MFTIGRTMKHAILTRSLVLEKGGGHGRRRGVNGFSVWLTERSRLLQTVQSKS
jgi:hypothetical protein